MKRDVDNYQLQMMQAKRCFLTYDQEELIRRCNLRYDTQYFYITFLSEPYRICRRTGDMERFTEDIWVDGNHFGEVMTILDWLCDSDAMRCISGNWVSMADLARGIHSKLQGGNSAAARQFSENAQCFEKACLALKGKAFDSADISYAVELMDGLQVRLQLWHGDEEFAPRLHLLWDANTLQYIRYETTWFAAGLLIDRILSLM